MNHEGHEETRNIRNEEERRMKDMRDAVADGCREMADVWLEIEKEFEAADAEVFQKYVDGEQDAFDQ